MKGWWQTFYKDCTVASLIEEKDPTKIRIKIFPPQEGESSWEFLFDEFIELLQQARNAVLPIDNTES